MGGDRGGELELDLTLNILGHSSADLSSETISKPLGHHPDIPGKPIVPTVGFDGSASSREHAHRQRGEAVRGRTLRSSSSAENVPQPLTGRGLYRLTLLGVYVNLLDHRHHRSSVPPVGRDGDPASAWPTRSTSRRPQSSRGDASTDQPSPQDLL